MHNKPLSKSSAFRMHKQLFQASVLFNESTVSGRIAKFMIFFMRFLQQRLQPVNFKLQKKNQYYPYQSDFQTTNRASHPHCQDLLLVVQSLPTHGFIAKNCLSYWTASKGF